MTYDLNFPPHMDVEKCPFCGGDAVLFADVDGVYAGCGFAKCLIKPITLTYATKRDALRAWNLRGPASKADPIVPVRGGLHVVQGEEE